MKKRRNRPLRKLIVIFCMLLTVMACLALSPIFNIKKINVIGLIHYKSQDIISSSGLFIDANWFKVALTDPKGLFYLRSTNAERDILSGRPYIKSVTVRLRKVGEVEINIEERKPTAKLSYLNTNFLVDNEGYILDAINGDSKERVPTIKGMELSQFAIGTRFRAKDSEDAEVLYKLMGVLASSDESGARKMYDNIDFIDMENTSDIGLFIDSRVLVKLGDIKDIDEYRINFLKEIFFTRIQKNEIGTLDFTLGEIPHFIPN